MQAKQCIDRALRHLGRKRLSRGELTSRLSADGFAPEDIRTAISKCLQWGYLDDRDYARSLIGLLQRKGFGPIHIRRALNARELPADVIEADLQSSRLEENEIECCRCALLKKTNGPEQPNEPLRYRRKLYAYLFRRGFSSDAISRVLEEFFDSTA